MMRNLLIRIQIVPGVSSAVWCYLFVFLILGNYAIGISRVRTCLLHDHVKWIIILGLPRKLPCLSAIQK